ncbi:MAG: TonB system transport protein ExbD [Cardiobacteriaceae bacterium]|nr:TonB system transport protein ExbD [Cardiobacteriaceae bacterium]
MKKFDQINVIPFIDIMLVLLAIVLTTASFIDHGVIAVQPPPSSTAQRAPDAIDDKRLISIDREGKFYLEQTPVSLDALQAEIAQWSAAQRVHLKLDAQTPFTHFVQIGDLLRARQIHQVHILVNPAEG